VPAVVTASGSAYVLHAYPGPLSALTVFVALRAGASEVTVLAARGPSDEEIAAHMVISPFTAKTRSSRAMTKLGARDRAQLVVFAHESGLVPPRGAC
jgi:DNA-binding NarL/FixJ family response regulator